MRKGTRTTTCTRTLTIIAALTFCIKEGHSFAAPRRNVGTNTNINSNTGGSAKRANPKRTTTTTTTPNTSSEQRRTTATRKATGYSYRKVDGIKMKRKRPPRWEVEGDSLFFLQNQNNGSKKKSKGKEDGDDGDGDEELSFSTHFDNLLKSISTKSKKNKDDDSVEELLALAFKVEEEDEESQQLSPSTTTSTTNNNSKEEESKEQTTQPPSSPSPYMWGTLPIGPVLKTKLNTIYDTESEPTPIQLEAFKVLTKNHKTKSNNNVVIASPTGSGKTLAYILPLLAISSNKDVRRTLIITPTLDLSYQIQKVVNQLSTSGSGSGSGSDNGGDAVYVMKDSKTSSSSSSFESSSKQMMEWNIEAMLLSKSPIIASTPKILLQIVNTCSSSNNKRFRTIFSDLKTIVLDEADRLLQTELVARHNYDLKHKKNGKGKKKSNNSNSESSGSGRNNKFANDCPTIQLLTALERKMGVSFDVQQQYQNQKFKNQRSFTSASSLGGGGGTTCTQLICASATVGRTLRTQIMEITNASSIDKGSILITADDRTGKNAMKRKSSLLPNSIEHLYGTIVSTNDNSDDDDDSENENEKDIIASICQSMKSLDSGPSIIFPGKVGVQKTVNLLQDTHGFKNVKTLRNNDTDEHLNEDSSLMTWSDTSIYVVGEKFGRGLDIPNVRYVFIASPPASPAAYTHLAGRTGRAGKDGVALTFVRDLKEAKRLFILSKKLGIQFGSIDSTGTGTGTEKLQGGSSSSSNCVDDVVVDNIDVVDVVGVVTDHSDDHQDVEDLDNLNVIALKDMLRERKLKVSGKKSELIARLKEDMVGDLN